MPEVLALMIPIIALLIPIVAIMSAHQQKMARIMAENASQLNGEQNELSRLRQDVYELKQVVNQQAIMMDDFLSSQKALASANPPPPPQSNGGTY